MLAFLVACTTGITTFASCTTFDGLTAREGGGGKGGSGEVPDGSSCERAIDLTFNKKASLQAPPEGNDQGECGGGLETDECKNPPELWFKYTLKTPAFLAVTALPTKPVTLDDACVKAERGAVVYARSSCDEGASELACLPLALANLSDPDQTEPGPTRLRLTEAGTVYFAVDGRLSDTNELDVTVEVEPICTSNADCKLLGRPVCDTSKNICYECLSSSDCKDPNRPVCDTAQGACVACQTNADCKSPDARICGPQGACVGEGSCCEESSIGGCKDSAVEACVCKQDDFCCTSEWDKQCVSEVAEFGCGLCNGQCKANTDCKEPTKPFCNPFALICAACGTDADCKDPTKPFCSAATLTCSACFTSANCKDPTKPVCTEGGCALSPYNSCVGDDKAEPGDDGPAGAMDLTPSVGNSKQETSHVICGSPLAEVDHYKVTVENTDGLTVTVDWADSQDLDVFVVDSAGVIYGLDYYSRPTVISLNYLPAGTYFIAIQRYDNQPSTAVTPYTIKVERTKGTKCNNFADCAQEFATQVFRGSCNAASGACEFIDGKGALTDGQVCDDSSDCASKVCGATPFTKDIDKQAFCTKACATDTDCTGERVCSAAIDNTGLPVNICAAKCTSNQTCPINRDVKPQVGTGPWTHLSCDKDKGKCYE